MNRNCPSLIRLAATILVALSAVPLQAKVVQPGRVRLQNSGNKPLAGVQVSFFGSNRTTSDGKGAFSLEFPDKKPGDGIVNPKVSKSGYEWVNEPDFHSVVASGEASIELVMCPAGQLSAQREKYYGLSEAATLAALERRLGALEGLRKRDEAAWQRQKDSLTKQSEQQLKQAREMADQFARFNFDDAGALHRQAFELFQTGRIDSAVRLLEGANLPKQLRGRYQERSLLSGQARGNDQEIRRLMPAMIFQAELYSLRMEYEKAAPLYDTLVLLDTNDVANLATVAEFYQKTWKDYGKCDYLNRRILSLDAISVWIRANAALSLGDVFDEMGKLDSAGRWFGKYHQLVDSLFRNDSTNTWYKSALTTSLERLGWCYQKQADFTKALEFFSLETRLLKELYQDTKNASIRIGLAVAYERLGSWYQNQDNNVMALELFVREVQIIEEEYQKNPSEKLKSKLAISYSVVGDQYKRQNDYAAALAFFLKSNNLSNELHRNNLKNEDLAKVLAISCEKLGDVRQKQGDFPKALDLYSQEIGLFEDLYRDNPRNESLKDGLAKSYGKAADIYQRQLRLDLAQEFFFKRNELGEELVRDNPKNESLRKGLAVSHFKLGGVYQAKGEFHKALDAFRNAVFLSNTLFGEHPDILNYAENTAGYMKVIGPLACQLGQKNEGIMYQKRAAELYDSLYRIYGSLWRLVAAGETYAALAACTDSLPVKIVYNKRALEHHLAVYKKDSSAYKNLVSGYWELAGLDMLAGAFAESESVARSAVLLLSKRGEAEQVQIFNRLIAHSLLFQGRFPEAESIYRDLKDWPFPQDTTKTFTPVLMNDLDALEKAGIVHPDVAKVRAMLSASVAIKPNPADLPPPKGKP